MVVRWANNGEEIKQYVEEKVGSASRKVQGVDHYFLPGIVFPRRTSSFCPKVMPEGGIYSTAGQSVFVPPDQLWSSLAILSSLVCDFLISLSQGVVSDKISGTNPQFEVGLVDRLPWPDVPAETRTLLEQLAKRIVKLKLEWANVTEPSSYFFRALLPTECGLPLADIAVTRSAIQQKHTRSITEAQSQIDELAADVFGLSQSERAEVNRSSRRGYNIPMDDRETGVLNSEDVASLDDAVTPSAVTESVMSYCVGVIFGRWDVRHQTNMTDETPLLDPYLPIPLLAPGILLEGNLPFSGKCSADYPIRIDGDGIMVDDADHTDDIMRRVRDVLELIWRGRAGAIEKESCEILKIKELREYFRRPSKGGFWDNHITRFSKGRRKAPIYWLLQSSKKNYGLWFYYHRLDKDLLFKALVNYVEPKLRLEDSRLDSLRSQKAATVDSGTAAKKIDKEIEKQEDLISELRDFEDKLRRAANLHLDPDLNDGVVLNIAPLHELVPWKEAKSYWNELIAGEYEWSSIGKQLREKGLVK